jgi:hypothetical protein
MEAAFSLASLSSWFNLSPSFYVLDHFAEALDGGFDFDYVAGDFHVAAFTADGVNFAEHFLGEKF